MKMLPIILTVLLTALTSTARSQSTEPLTFSVSPGQVTEAAVALTADGDRLRMILTPEKRAEFAVFTQRNLGRQVKIIIAEKLVSEPVIRTQIKGGSIEVFVASPEEGLSVAKVLLAK